MTVSIAAVVDSGCSPTLECPAHMAAKTSNGPPPLWHARRSRGTARALFASPYCVARISARDCRSPEPPGDENGPAMVLKGISDGCFFLPSSFLGRPLDEIDSTKSAASPALGQGCVIRFVSVPADSMYLPDDGRIFTPLLRLHDAPYTKISFFPVRHQSRDRGRVRPQPPAARFGIEGARCWSNEAASVDRCDHKIKKARALTRPGPRRAGHCKRRRACSRTSRGRAVCAVPTTAPAGCQADSRASWRWDWLGGLRLQVFFAARGRLDVGAASPVHDEGVSPWAQDFFPG